MMPPCKLYFLGLNAVRVLSLVSLGLVFSSTIVVVITNVKAVNAFEADKQSGDNSTMINCDYIMGSTVPNQPAGVFWAVVASLLIIVQCVILSLSELGWPMTFFDRYFPVLGTEFGLGALGIFQALISTQILSHHVDELTLVSAFLLFALGCLNMFLGLIFRESAKSKRSIASWRAEAKGILPIATDNRPIFVNNTPFVSAMFNGSSQEKSSPTPVWILRETDSDAKSWSSTEKAGYGFSTQGEKAAQLRGFILQKPDESLSRYAASPVSTSRPSSPPGLESRPSTRPSTTVSRGTSGTFTISSFYAPEPQIPVPSLPEIRALNVRRYSGEERDFHGDKGNNSPTPI